MSETANLDQLPWEVLERILLQISDAERGLALVALHSSCRSIFYQLAECKNLWKWTCLKFDKWAETDSDHDWYKTFLRYLELWSKLRHGVIKTNLQNRFVMSLMTIYIFKCSEAKK